MNVVFIRNVRNNLKLNLATLLAALKVIVKALTFEWSA